MRWDFGWVCNKSRPLALAIGMSSFCCPFFCQADESVKTPFGGGVPSYNCHYVYQEVNLDGKLYEDAWYGAWTRNLDFDHPDDERQIQKSAVKFLWSGDVLYVGVEVYDDDMVALASRRDAPLWLDDSVGVLIKPWQHSSIYYEFQVNALGCIFDACWNHPRAVGWRRGAIGWNGDIGVAVGCLGSAEDEMGRRSGWCVEMAIPSQVLNTSSSLPPTEDLSQWQISVCRYDQAAGGREPRLSALVPIDAVAEFDVPHRFMTLYLYGNDLGRYDERWRWHERFAP